MGRVLGATSTTSSIRRCLLRVVTVFSLGVLSGVLRFLGGCSCVQVSSTMTKRKVSITNTYASIDSIRSRYWHSSFHLLTRALLRVSTSQHLRGVYIGTSIGQCELV